MELRLPLEMSPGREAACRAVFGTWGFFPNDARKNCPFVLTAFTGRKPKRLVRRLRLRGEMSGATSERAVAGHFFDAQDRCERCRRHRFECATGNLLTGCCYGTSNDYELKQLEAIRDRCWQVTQDIAAGRGAGSVQNQESVDD